MSPAYLAEVEQAFITRAGRGLMLSPHDRGLVERWARAGVPADVVVQGISNAFERAGNRRVRGLGYTVPAVEDAIKAWQSRHVGRIDESGATTAHDEMEHALAELLDRMHTAGRAQTDEQIRGAMRDIWRAIVTIRDDWRRGALTEVGAALDALSERARLSLLIALDPADRRRIEYGVEAALAGYSIADPVARAASRDALIWRRLRGQLGLPALELDMGGGWG